MGDGVRFSTWPAVAGANLTLDYYGTPGASAAPALNGVLLAPVTYPGYGVVQENVSGGSVGVGPAPSPAGGGGTASASGFAATALTWLPWIAAALFVAILVAVAWAGSRSR